MSNTEQLTIYVTEGDRANGKLLYRALMEAAQQSNIVGMTVARAAVGYSQRHRYIGVDWMPELAKQMIVVLTAIDRPEAITRYIPHIQNLVQDGLAFTERVTVVHHTPVVNDQPDFPLHDADPLSDLEDPMTDYERLTIYVGESDQWRGKPVHLALVEEARRQGMIGATVLRGMTGYGKHNQERIKFLGIIELSSDLPMMVSMIDRTEKIEQFLPLVQEMVVGGIVVRDPVRVVHHAPVNSSN
ncbi:DUF190 domain-containing protein [Leptolyngbya sp. NK1-12]|uniref:DUF190 domain-containing protein n=1 Tax=Leptolyngbya sp. NK1-12 TaxID=2547451 RepID=A0AA97AJA7_9CYAN|nr:DUF190 domain-containing protein [Leptolyngbya sp. NK1-12]WNZ24706.1 DUF190 domain-containing protein [Leptolyngbya sp. NK1-12]